MPLQKLPVTGLDDINHRRRARETLNQVLDHSFDDSRVRTQAEVAAGVTPVNYAYAPGDVRRYGIKGDGTDEHVAIQAALDVAGIDGGNVIFPVPPVAYGLGADGVTVPENVLVIGDTCEQVIFTFSGTGFAFGFTRGGNGLQNVYIITSHVDGSAMIFGNNCRRSILRRVTAECAGSPAADRTGTGIRFFTTDAATTFSGNMLLEQVYLLGYKYGMDFNCFEIPFLTWTCVVGSQIFIVGPGAGVCAGSRCIRMDENTNGVGCSIFGGTLENCEVSIEVANGGFGINYYGDIEGNTSDLPLLGASWCGEIVAHPAGIYIRGGSNNTANKWFREQHLNGVMDRESYYGQKYTVWNDSGANAISGFFRGDSAIEGGTPTCALGVNMSTDDDLNAPERNWIVFGTRKMSWGSATPASATWSQGDVVWNTGVTAGGSPGWVCTTGGTPGTWKAMAAVAA